MTDGMGPEVQPSPFYIPFTTKKVPLSYTNYCFQVRTGYNTSAKPTRRFIKLYFHIKLIDKGNLTNILHNKLVTSKVPIYFQKEDPPLVSYTYKNNIFWSVFDYNQTFRNINFDD